MFFKVFSCTQVLVKREKVTWHGAKIQKQGEGMPNYDNNQRKGILYITFNVDFPRGTFSEQEKNGHLILVLIYVIFLFVCRHHFNSQARFKPKSLQWPINVL